MSSLLIDSVKLEYRMDGAQNAPVLVLLHCLGANLHMWDLQVAALSPQLRIVRHDCRGHGKSGFSDQPLTIARLGQDLLALLEHLAIPRAHICGLSLGGMTALWFAANHPERVERAVFANTGARIGTAESWEARIAAVRTGGMAAIREIVVARCLSEAFRARAPAPTRALGDMIEASDPAGYIAACVALRDGDLRSSVSSISAPSLIIAGALDQSTPLSLAEELRAAIPQSKLVVIQEAAHLSNINQPAAFNDALLKFLT